MTVKQIIHDSFLHRSMESLIEAIVRLSMMIVEI